jgi:2-methylcitrate dehydratase
LPDKTQVERLAEFAHRAAFDQIPAAALERLKLHVLDTLGCAIAALDSPPTQAVRRQAEAYLTPHDGPCTFIGGGKAPPDRAALVNGALVRYLDFMDNFLAPAQTCHPCDTFAATLAAAEVRQLSGRDFLTCLAVAYQVFCRLVHDAPVQEAGFDHTVQLAYGVAAGTAKALGLSVEQTAHALAIVGASAQGLVVTRAEYLSNWKGLQSADVTTSALTGVLLAQQGITGPLQVLDGKEGFPKAFKQKVNVDWEHEPLDILLRCSLKAHNAEVHTQPVLSAVLHLRTEHQLQRRIDDIERVEVEVFKQAYDITGAGEEAGNKYDVRTKEQADHSLPYLVAVALLDGEVTPRQFVDSRLMRSDVQQLLHKVRTLRDDEFTRRYPDETPVRVVVEFKDGRSVAAETHDWLGFYSRPMPCDEVRYKYDALVAGHVRDDVRDELADMVLRLEDARVSELTALLAQAHPAS